MSLFRKTPTATLPTPVGTGPAISLDRVPTGLVSLAKEAAVSLDKGGLTGQRAAVYLVLDHSGSMHSYYASGSMQRLAEQALGLAVNLDDDGQVPLVYFGSRVAASGPVQLNDYAGVIDRTHHLVPWGSTDYVAAIRHVTEYHTARGGGPALVIFQSDGEPDDRAAAERALREASELPLFWAFVGFGNRISFLERLDDLRGRRVDNASFFHARYPHQVTDGQLYDGLTHEYGPWLAAAHAAGITG